MCSCSEFEHLEFLRKVVSRRIKESHALKQSMNVIAKHPEGEHKLYRCGECGQLWQGSRAWNWGNEEYLFRVSRVDVDSWKSEVFVQPDELLIFTAVMDDYISQNAFTDRGFLCNTPDCGRKAVLGTANCLRHHIESLQRVGNLPPDPKGRWFHPYVRENIVLDL